MGKPLSRPDCLRQNPTCLGKGEEEDGYIEDCYVPQRSIYDTMRINEQIDQGSKLNQTSKGTMEKLDGSTISSNGTLGGASNVFDSRAPEGKKLDERIIFDALKLSSDVQKSAPVPPRRRPNAERKDNVNRRSWKSFMPPNFPEFAERMEASLSEVSEAGISNPSLQEKKESSSVLTESSGHLDSGEPQSVTLEHIPKSIGIPEVQDAKNLYGECKDFRLQQHNETSSHEFQPIDSEAAAASNTDVTQEHRFSSATWPRAIKSLAKGSFCEKQYPLGDTACTIEMPPLSPCLSEELLDPELHVLITPSLREKTESELKFEEDERWIMMETEEWGEEKLAERRITSAITNEKKNSLTDIFEESEQANTVAVIEEGAVCSADLLETLESLSVGQICDTEASAKSHLDSVVKDTSLDDSCLHTGESAVGELKNRTGQGREGLDSVLECTIGPLDSEQLSDTDSVQMFLELEKECLCEEGVTSLVEMENQASSERLAPSQDVENSLVVSHFPGALEKEPGALSNVSVKDSDTGLDCDYFNTRDSSLVPNALEIIAHSDTTEESEEVPFSPSTAGEFKFRHSVNPEFGGKLDPEGLSNPDSRASCENESGVEAELAKENGSFSQVEYSHIEGSFGEYVDGDPLSSAFSSELADVTSGSEVEVLLCDSHLLTDAIHLGSEKGAIIKQDSDPTTLGHFELSMDKIYDKDGEAHKLGSEVKLLEDRTLEHVPSNFPEQTFQDLQRKSPEILSTVEGLRHCRDEMGTVNDNIPGLNVASSEAAEAEMGDWDSLLNEHILKASDIGPVPQTPVPVAAAEDPSVASVVTIEETDTPAFLLFASEEKAPAAASLTIGDDIIEGSVTQATIVPTPEETDIPVVNTPEGPTTPATIVPNPEEPAAMAAAVPTTGEPNAPAATMSTLDELAILAAKIHTPGEPNALAAAVPILVEPDSPIASVPTPEEPAAPDAAVATSEEPETPAAAMPTLEDPDIIPVATVSSPEDPDTPAAAVSILEEPDIPAAAIPALDVPNSPVSAVFIPEEPDTPTAAVPTPEEPDIPAAVPTTEEVFLSYVPFLGDTAHTDSVPISEEGASVLEEASPTGMWIKEDLDSPAFGMKEVTHSVLLGKVPKASIDELNSNEVIFALFCW